MLEDKLLIWKFKQGSNEALCGIYHKYGDYLLSLAAALLKDVNAAEDVLHDVFCRFIESRENFKLAGSLKSYLGTCVVNLARDRLRARKLQPCELGEITLADTNAQENYKDALVTYEAILLVSPTGWPGIVALVAATRYLRTCEKRLDAAIEDLAIAEHAYDIAWQNLLDKYDDLHKAQDNLAECQNNTTGHPCCP